MLLSGNPVCAAAAARAQTAMKLIISIFVVAASISAVGQGTFQNLDFEAATLSPTTGAGGPVPVGSALPDWTVYFGTVQQTVMFQNTFSAGDAQVDILGPNWPLPGPSDIIDGNYTVALGGGINPQDETQLVSASIAQTGLVPIGTESMQLKVSDPGDLLVSFAGNNLPLVILGSGPNYTLCGVDISAYAGQTGQLEFTSPVPTIGLPVAVLDDITFSTQAVPEPGTLVLTGIGGLLFALYRRLAPRRP
jgi:hypothetical protein